MSKHLSLLNAPTSLQSSFTVAAYDVDQYKRMTTEGLITQLQEVALASTRQLKVSVFDLEPLHLGWVLLGQRLEISSFPELTDRCTVITAPTGFQRVFTYRDFHLLNEADEVVASATTTWMLMDTQSRKMARFPDWIKALDEHTPPASARMKKADYKLQPPSEADFEQAFRVGYHDLDYNGHLTNPVYVRWMLEALPFEMLANGQLVQLEIQYAKEARYGDELSAVAKKTSRDGVFHHGLYLGEECLATMQTVFSTSGRVH